MPAFVGLVLGAGLFLVWRAMWVEEPTPRQHRPTANARIAEKLRQAGITSVNPTMVTGASVAIGVLAFVVAAGLTGSAPIGLILAVLASRAPMALISSRARARTRALRDVWPEVIDHLASAVRAGLALPEALGQLGERGPTELRGPFRAFAADYRATGKFTDCLDSLKERLASPVGDRIVEVLRVTRDVGGTDLGAVLRALSEYLREDNRTRGELEARQSWTVNAARLAVVAPWVVLLALASRPEAAAAYNTPGGVMVLSSGAVLTVVAYRIMARLGRLPAEARVLR